MERLSLIISENLRLAVTNIHIRFEDNSLSRRDSRFNFGLMCDSVNYSVTNGNFERIFINIDEKRKEQRAFSMLEVKQIAAYWNSNTADNWSEDREFPSLPADRLIEMSQKYTEGIKKRYAVSQ